MRGWMAMVMAVGLVAGCMPPEGTRALAPEERAMGEALREEWVVRYGAARCDDALWDSVGIAHLSPEAFTEQTGWCADRECGERLGYYWTGATGYHYIGWDALIMIVTGHSAEKTQASLEHELFHVWLRCEVGSDPNHANPAWDEMGFDVYRI